MENRPPSLDSDSDRTRLFELGLLKRGPRIFWWTVSLKNPIPTKYPSEFSVDGRFSSGARTDN